MPPRQLVPHRAHASASSSARFQHRLDRRLRLVRRVAVLPRELEAGHHGQELVPFVMAHNRPGGDPAPSAEDVLLTQEVEHAAYLNDVPLRDHVIVTPAGRFSSVLRAGSPR
ncbi:JAB domain-containing protein [Sorangium sp. So ce764]